MSALVQKIPEGYKQVEIGIIPNDWEAKSVGDVTAWLSGGTPSRKREDYWQGNIPWISGSTLKSLELSTSDQSLTKEGVEAGSKMAPLNSTLLLVRGSALHNEIRAGLVVAPLCFNQDVKALIPNSNIVPRYLTIYLLAMESELLKLVSSAGNSAGVLDTELVKNFKFLNPPKEEQTAIANALSDVDALLTELEKLIAKKQAIKTATMQQLLTGKTRLPQFATYTEGTLEGKSQGVPEGESKGTKSSELGEIPEDWDVVSISKLTRNIIDYRGRTPKKLGMDWGGGDIVALSAGNVKKGYIDLEEECYLGSDELYKKWMKNGDVEQNDIVFTMEAPLGNVALVPDSKRYILSQRTISLQLNREEYESTFVYQLMMSDQFQKLLSDSATGSTAQGIKRTRFEQLPLCLPSSKDEQTAIATILSDMDNEIQTLEQRLAKTRQIKQGMMQALLTGRTRLPFDRAAQQGN